MVLSSLNYRLLANFFNFVMELKTIKRSGWINKVKVKDPESCGRSHVCNEYHGNGIL